MQVVCCTGSRDTLAYIRGITPFFDEYTGQPKHRQPEPDATITELQVQTLVAALRT